jgi:hypothetical protein
MEVSCHFRRDARRESFDPNTRDLLRLSVHGDGDEGADPAVQFETRFLGRVVVYKLTDRARLEVEASAHPVSAQVDGRVLETRLMIGREVRAGDVLIVLDAEVARLAIEKRPSPAPPYGERIGADFRRGGSEGKRCGLYQL